MDSCKTVSELELYMRENPPQNFAQLSAWKKKFDILESIEKLQREQRVETSYEDVLDAFHKGVDDDLLLNVDITPDQGSIQGGSGVNGNDGQGEDGDIVAGEVSNQSNNTETDDLETEEEDGRLEGVVVECPTHCELSRCTKLLTYGYHTKVIKL